MIHVLARALIIDQDYLLLCKTLNYNKNFYFLPGGHIENSERATDALRRELIEECGYEFNIGDFLFVFEHIFIPEHKICHNHEYNLIYKASCDSLVSQNIIPQLEAHIKLEWIKIDQLGNIDFRPKAMIKIIQKYLP